MVMCVWYTVLSTFSIILMTQENCTPGHQAKIFHFVNKLFVLCFSGLNPGFNGANKLWNVYEECSKSSLVYVHSLLEVLNRKIIVQWLCVFDRFFYMADHKILLIAVCTASFPSCVLNSITVIAIVITNTFALSLQSRLQYHIWSLYE